MEGLMINQNDGGKYATRNDLALIPCPEPTDSWHPIPHYELSNLILTVSQDMLKDYVLVSEQYGLAQRNNQLFAILNFQGDSKEMAMSIAFRSSLNKSMAFGLAFGSSCFVCQNLALQGDIVVMRKFSKNVLETLEDTVISNIYRAEKSYLKILIDSERLKSRGLTNREAAHLMGILYMDDTISPRQLTVLRDEWLRPTHAEFQPRNAWSFLNGVTHSLKTSPPLTRMEKNVRAYNTIIDI